MDTTLLLVLLMSLFWGYLLYRCIAYLLKKETYRIDYALHFFKIPIVQFFCALTGSVIYLYHGISPEFFLYSGFASILLIITYTDFIQETIYDCTIIFGVLYTLLFQFYLGDIQFALLGSIAAFLITFTKYLVGNYFFSPSCIDIEAKDDDVKHYSCMRFAFVPSLTIATIINALLPDGLAVLFIDIIIYIQSNNLIRLAVVILSVILIIWTMNSRKYLSSGFIVFSGSDENSDNLTAFGDGDIATSIFLGTVLGWQNFIAVFWLGIAISGIVGVYLGFKLNVKENENGYN